MHYSTTTDCDVSPTTIKLLTALYPLVQLDGQSQRYKLRTDIALVNKTVFYYFLLSIIDIFTTLPSSV